eukprot:TRINITY_DN16004_c0_g1_i1.p2 TRINITY_DN16004_c0_g1~~TRINITY_DN16004_c0_g1_i1.p2  ORF type:complete len:162 (-),score=33.01 TRINITY_DN16004_c0_g1_i1:465-950(-)
MYHHAQQLRRSSGAVGTGAVDGAAASPPAVSAEQARGLQEALAALESATRTVVMPGHAPWDLTDVAEILEARYGYTSLTATPDDVTEAIRSRHRDGELRLRTVNLEAEYGKGWADGMRQLVAGKRPELRLVYRSTAEPDPNLFFTTSPAAARPRRSCWPDA